MSKKVKISCKLKDCCISEEMEFEISERICLTVTLLSIYDIFCKYVIRLMDIKELEQNYDIDYLFELVYGYVSHMISQISYSYIEKAINESSCIEFEFIWNLKMCLNR